MLQKRTTSPVKKKSKGNANQPALTVTCSYRCTFSTELLQCRNKTSQCHNWLHHMCGVNFVDDSDYTNDDNRSYFCLDCNHKTIEHEIFTKAISELKVTTSNVDVHTLSQHAQAAVDKYKNQVQRGSSTMG